MCSDKLHRPEVRGDGYASEDNEQDVKDEQHSVHAASQADPETEL